MKQVITLLIYVREGNSIPVDNGLGRDILELGKWTWFVLRSREGPSGDRKHNLTSLGNTVTAPRLSAVSGPKHGVHFGEYRWDVSRNAVTIAVITIRPSSAGKSKRETCACHMAGNHLTSKSKPP
jgi:hypothetical protein